MNILRALLVCGCAMLLGIAGAEAQGVEPQVIIQTPVVPYIGGAAIGSGNPAPVTCISGCASPVVASSGGSAVLAVGAASANVALPASVTSFPTLLLVNNGTVDLFYNVGVGSGTAATTSPGATNLKLPAGRAIQFAPATSVTYVAAILASGSTATELDIYQLTAPAIIAGGGGSGGGGGGGAVTIADGAAVTQGTTTDAACGTDNGPCTTEALVKRLNQRITTLITALGAAPAQQTGAAVQANAGTNLNTSALALETGGNLAQIVTDFGAPGATACSTDTASCNQNQQLQRLAQRLSALITALGTPMQATGGTVTVGNANGNGHAAAGGSSPVVANTVLHASVTALGTSLVAKASAANLYAFNCTGIAGAAAGNCIAYNGTAAPATGSLTGANVLDACNFGTGTNGCSLSRLPNNVAYSAGIVILCSSAASPFTYTTGTDTCFISADYD